MNHPGLYWIGYKGDFATVSTVDTVFVISGYPDIITLFIMTSMLKKYLIYKLRPISLSLKAQLILRFNIGRRAWSVDELEEKLNLILREKISY